MCLTIVSENFLEIISDLRMFDISLQWTVEIIRVQSRFFYYIVQSQLCKGLCYSDHNLV